MRMSKLLALSLLLVSSALAATPNTGNLDYNNGGILPRGYVKNGNAQLNTTGWACYADAAGADPVDGTGGSPNVTWTRSTTSPLAGEASFLFTKDAADRSGQGCSYAFTIDRADRGKFINGSIELEVASGTYAANDAVIAVYDVTNSRLVGLNYGRGIPLATSNFLHPFQFLADGTSTSYRVIFHVSSTSTSAWTLKIDSVKIGQAPPTARGAYVGPWQTYIPTLNSTTNTTSNTGRWRAVGDSIEVESYVQFTGAGAASPFTVGLPNGLTIDSAKIVGSGVRNGRRTGTWFDDSSGNFYTVNVYPLATLNGVGITINSTAPINSSSLANNDSVSLAFTVPIAGWDAGSAVGETGTFRLSNYLVAGTRVTSAPTALGQYRTQLRNAGANTFTDTNGAPTDSPSSANGMRIYDGNAFSSADSSGNPTRYDLFIGKNKTFRMEWYATTGRTGIFSATPYTASSSEDVGYREQYDPTTGVLTLQAHRQGGSADHTSGTTDGNSSAQDPYFDVIVSDMVIPVVTTPLRHEVLAYSCNGHGSTNTKIRRFSSTAISGTAITYADSATLGATFTIVEPGIYTVSYTDTRSGGTSSFGVSKNATVSSNITALAASELIGYTDNSVAAFYANFSDTLYLEAGAVIRAHTEGNNNSTAVACRFRITKVGN